MLLRSGRKITSEMDVVQPSKKRKLESSQSSHSSENDIKKKLRLTEIKKTPDFKEEHIERKETSDNEDSDTEKKHTPNLSLSKPQALIFETKNANFSLAYDALTIYPYISPQLKFIRSLLMSPFVNPSIIYAYKNAVYACQGLAFVMQNELDKTPEFKSKFDEPTFVHRDDDAHNLYHFDKFNKEDDHFHIKFRTMLTREQFIEILNIFVKYKALTRDEKKQFLKQFDDRFHHCRVALDEAIANASSSNKETKESDVEIRTNAIIKFISECKNNDNLVDLHAYLLSTQFDDLRTPREKFYHGIDKEGHVAKTSQSWAMIEKAINLQMSLNIQKNSHFTSKLAKSVAKQLSTSHPFFSIKHVTEDNWKDPVSPTFKDFKAGKTLDDRYESHFHKKYS